ncbi:hypothetical protein RJ55_04303 [Drechmeria coniospora]|nr:hypothetical protein RJ55_04303 [Drechmeria coniospora]
MASRREPAWPLRRPSLEAARARYKTIPPSTRHSPGRATGTRFISSNDSTTSSLVNMKAIVIVVTALAAVGLAIEYPRCRRKSSECIIACPHNQCRPGYVCCVTDCGGRICEPIEPFENP